MTPLEATRGGWLLLAVLLIPLSMSAAPECVRDDECKLAAPPGREHGCPSCGTSRLAAEPVKRSTTAVELSVLPLSRERQERLTCPKCIGRYLMDLPICEEGRCILSHDSALRVWIRKKSTGKPRTNGLTILAARSGYFLIPRKQAAKARRAGFTIGENPPLIDYSGSD